MLVSLGRLTFQPSRRKAGVSNKIGARRHELHRNIEHILSKFVAEYVNFAKQRPVLQWTAELSTRPNQKIPFSNCKVRLPIRLLWARSDEAALAWIFACNILVTSVA